MDKVTSWFRSKNITSHTAATLLVLLAGIISFDTQAQSLLVSLLKSHPTMAVNIIALAGIIAKYTHSSSPAGTMATARNIASQSDAPTSSQVDAASTQKP